MSQSKNVFTQVNETPVLVSAFQDLPRYQDRIGSFVGLDVETTGTEDWCSLIQIGVSLERGKTFVSDVGWKPGEYRWQAEAQKANGFTLERVEAGPPARDVDDRLYWWLAEHALDNTFDGRKLVPVGFNVGSFDMLFVRRTLPSVARLFTHRSFDLNTACFLLGGTLMWEKVKADAKSAVARTMGQERYHDAGYDAEHSLLVLDYLRTKIFGAPVE